MKKNKLIKESMKIKTREDFSSAPKGVQDCIRDRVSKTMDGLPAEVQTGLREALKEADTPEEFQRLTMVGDCPRCGSSKTRDCEDSPLGDPCVGMCLDCAVLWCLECGQVFGEARKICDHWAICDACKFISESKEVCTADVSLEECSIIEEERRKVDEGEVSRGGEA